jgi:hypothetical protein
MRKITFKLGKRELINYNNNKQPNIKILKTDGNLSPIRTNLNNISSLQKYHLLSPIQNNIVKLRKNISFKKNNINNPINYNKLLQSGFYPFKRPIIPKLRINKNFSNNNLKMNLNNKDRSFKLISINNKKIDFPKELYLTEENKEKIEFKKENSYIESRNLSLPKIEEKKGLSLGKILNSENKKNFDEFLLKKEIKKSDTNLINYLKRDNIQPSFVKKINKANDEKLRKLDKICQKHLHNEKEEFILRNNIQNKISERYTKDSEYIKIGLQNVNNSLKGIEQICNEFQNKMEIAKENKIKLLKQIKTNNIFGC